jgi:hypothetical protein
MQRLIVQTNRSVLSLRVNPPLYIIFPAVDLTLEIIQHKLHVLLHQSPYILQSHPKRLLGSLQRCSRNLSFWYFCTGSLPLKTCVKGFVNGFVNYIKGNLLV